MRSNHGRSDAQGRGSLRDHLDGERLFDTDSFPRRENRQMFPAREWQIELRCFAFRGGALGQSCAEQAPRETEALSTYNGEKTVLFGNSCTSQASRIFGDVLGLALCCTS